MSRRTIPLRQRPVDIAIVAFFLVNLLFITYVVDLEQLVIANPSHFTYPLWPPGPVIDLIHWYGRTFDHDLIARPVWWKVTIWIDNLLFGPFYVFAIYAYVKGRDWIRIPSVVYASILLTNVLIILGEEYAGAYSAGVHFPLVFLANLPWLVFPFVIIARMWRGEHPFTTPASADQPAAPSLAATGQRDQIESQP
ncbi:MAG TPA: emopamil-binding family protein [Ktedonobacterales bacterium]|nr:emopamil-binding family protein [Ktedonobacterales bacterium]